MTKTFKVASVSKNTNAFGLSGVVLVAADGEAFEAASYCMGCFVLAKGETLDLIINNQDATGINKYFWVTAAGRVFEIPRALPKAPVEILRELFSDVWVPPTIDPRLVQVKKDKAAYRAEPPAAVTFQITDFSVVCIDPQADNESLAAKGRRVMLRRKQRAGTFSLFVAEAGVLTAGYVVGIERV